MIKVLNIIPNGINSNGISSSWYILGKELQNSQYKNNFEITFTYSIENSNIKNVRDYEKVGFKTILLPSRDKNPIKYFFSLWRILKKDGFDIIHVNGSSSIMAVELFAAFLADVKIRIAHSRNTICLHRKLHSLLNIPFKWLVNGRLACGYDSGKWLFSNKEFKVLHNGKDFSKFHYSESIRFKVREELNLKDKLVIGHVGRFNNQKNHSYLIDIFKCISDKNPNSILIMIGDGELFENVKNKVKELDLSDKVIFTGAISDVHRFLQAIDIMIFPSLYEGLPNVVLEWQAIGIPCIISDTITKECVVSNLVSFENILKTPDAWAKRTFEILKDVGDRELNSTKALIELRKAGFEIKDTLKELIDFYNKQIAKHFN